MDNGRLAWGWTLRWAVRGIMERAGRRAGDSMVCDYRWAVKRQHWSEQLILWRQTEAAVVSSASAAPNKGHA